MNEDRAAELVAALAELAGRRIGPDEAAAVVARSRELSGTEANAIWTQARRAPATVSLRDYLAMTLRFVQQDPGAG